MKKKLICILFVILFTLFCLTVVSYGASSSASASSKSIKVGDTVSVYVNVSNAAAWDINVSYSGLTLQSGETKIVNTSSSGDNVSQRVGTLKFKATKAGSYTVSLSGTVVDQDFKESSAKGSVTISVTKPTTTTNKPSNNTSGGSSNSSNTPAKKSSNANLTAIKVAEGELTPKFSKSVKSYTLNVAKDIEEIEITATKENSKATYKVTRK